MSEEVSTDLWKDPVWLIGFICAILLVIWSFLKMFGVINTPLILEWFGAGVGSITILTIVYKIGIFVNEIKSQLTEIISINKRFNKVECEHNLYLQGKLKK